MRKFLLLAVVTSLLFISSCGSDSDGPTPTHEVGQWSLDSYALQGFPTGFEDNEGLLLRIDQITLGGLEVESYELMLNIDGTYTRTIDVTGPNINDNGTWTLDDDDLELESEDGNFQEFDVNTNEDNNLWLVERNSLNVSFIPDIYFDTVTQAYIDFVQSLTQEQQDSVDNALSQTIQVDLVYLFERD